MPTKTPARIKIAVMAALLVVAAQATLDVRFAKYSEPPWKSGETTVTLSPDGTLSVSGNGAMENYGDRYYLATAPWLSLYNLKSRSIKRLVIEEGVTYIGRGAFMYCWDMTSVTIPNSVTSIGGLAFWGTGLTSVTIPNSVTAIGVYAFHECSLTSVTIPNSVTAIGRHAFDGCYSLTTVTIPGSVAAIDTGTFVDCAALTSVTIENGVTVIDVGAFSSCTSLTSVTIPNSVTHINDIAFAYCGMTSVTIPSSVKSIGDRVFEGCRNLTSIIILNPKPPEISPGTFDNINDNPDIKIGIPAGAAFAYLADDVWKDVVSIPLMDIMWFVLLCILTAMILDTMVFVVIGRLRKSSRKGVV